MLAQLRACTHAPAHESDLKRPAQSSDTEMICKTGAPFAVAVECGRRQWQLDSPVLCRECDKSDHKGQRLQSLEAASKTRLHMSDGGGIFV